MTFSVAPGNSPLILCFPHVGTEVPAAVGAWLDDTSIFTGRFKGGWTTRHYGRPERGVHDFQMELAQSTRLAGILRGLVRVAFDLKTNRGNIL